MEEVIASDFQCLTTPFEITQYLRGRLHIYVDFVMTIPDAEEKVAVPRIIGFLKLVVKLIARWLALLPNHMQAVRPEEDLG